MVGSIVAVSLTYVFVQGNDKTLYFLHQNDIIKGKHLAEVGEHVEFTAAPPLIGKRHPRATRATVGGGQ